MHKECIDGMRMIILVCTASTTCLCGCVEGSMRACSDVNLSPDAVVIPSNRGKSNQSFRRSKSSISDKTPMNANETAMSTDNVFSDTVYCNPGFTELIPVYVSEDGTNLVFNRKARSVGISPIFQIYLDSSRFSEAVNGNTPVIWIPDTRIEPQNEFQFLTNILSTLEIAMGKTVKASFTSEQFEEKRLFSRYWNAINSFDADALPEDSLATVKELVAYTEIFFPVHFSFTSNRVDVSLYEDGKSILYRTQEAYDDTLVDDFFA